MQGAKTLGGWVAEKLPRFGRLIMGDNWCLGIEAKVEHSLPFTEEEFRKAELAGKLGWGFFSVHGALCERA